MANVLIIDADNKTQQLLSQAFDSRRIEYGEINSAMWIANFETLPELLVGIVFDVVLIDESFINDKVDLWFAALRRKFPNLQCPILLTGHTDDALKIMNAIEAGFMDYIIKPIDKPLLLEKVFLFAHGSRPIEGRQVYSLRMQHTADMAKSAIVTEMSEFDCKIVSRFPYMLGEILTIYSRAFSDSETQVGRVLARCYRCLPVEGSGGYEAYFSYLGVNSATLQKIRANLRKEYAASKGNI
jgi:response regulator RpfG family c-di-GMP phosphodiesterase